MTVYVDDASIPASVRNGSRVHTSTWCHLTADTQEELHAFAARLGLKRSYFQPGKPLGGKPSPFWHYDLTAGKRAQAVNLGAVQVPYRDMPALMRARVAPRAEPPAPAPAPPTRRDLVDSAQIAQFWAPGHGGRSTGCNAPECGQPGRPYAAGIRCDAHKPVPTFRPSAEVAMSDTGAVCPCCSRSRLTAGREICQGCGAVAAYRAARAQRDLEAGS